MNKENDEKLKLEIENNYKLRNAKIIGIPEDWLIKYEKMKNILFCYFITK